METIFGPAGAPLARPGAPVTGNRWGSRRGLGHGAWLVGLLILWQRRLRDREVLRDMSSAQLLDIGLSRDDALREAEKPFWRR